MFGVMNGQNTLHSHVPQDRSLASFDAEFRRSLRDFLERDLFVREGIDPSRIGRIVVGDPGFVRQCLVDGCDVQPDTADGVRNASFVQRLQRGSSPNLRSVERVRNWMHAQLRGEQRRAVIGRAAAVASTTTALPYCAVPAECPAPAESPRVRTWLNFIREESDD